MRAAATVRTNSKESSALSPPSSRVKRRARDLHQVIDRHRLRIGVHVGELRDEPGALRSRLTHSHDASAADADACRANPIERIEAIVEAACRDHLAIELGRGIDVVVVVVEPCRLERLGLAVLEQAERAARLEPERLHLAHHREHRREVAILRPAPCGAHAEARRALGPRRASRCDDRVEIEHRLVGDAGVIALRLRAIAAVLRAAACLDRDEAGELDGRRRMMRAMHFLRAKDEIRKRKREQAQDACHAPAHSRLAGCAGAGRPAGTKVNRAFGGWHCGDLRGFLVASRLTIVAECRGSERSCQISTPNRLTAPSDPPCATFAAMLRCALPQRCELCVAHTGGTLLCAECERFAAAHRGRVSGLRAAVGGKPCLWRVRRAPAAVRRNRRGFRLCVSHRSAASADQIRRPDRARRMGWRRARHRGGSGALRPARWRPSGPHRSASARALAATRARLQPGAGNFRSCREDASDCHSRPRSSELPRVRRRPRCRGESGGGTSAARSPYRPPCAVPASPSSTTS